MNTLALTVVVFASIMASSSFALELATPCDVDRCQLPDCKCSTTSSGNDIPLEETPQIVMMSFDDAVTQVAYDFFVEAFFGLKNPDGCPVGATHFISHEYTDYSKVHNLWKEGHEIALHSVTHSVDQEYWRTLDLPTMEAEFGDMKKILAEFADIDESDVHGIRMPFLQLAGNVTLQGIQSLGLTYDSSMPTQRYMDPALWPYTFDFLSTQECNVPPCPDAAFPGVWQVPMINWKDLQGNVCSMVDACVNVPDTEEAILEWLMSQFERHYKGSRAPFPFFMHAAWFLRNPENFKAYKSFIAYLQTREDVYIVNVKKAIDWIRNPKPISSEKPFGECELRVAPSQCTPKTCRLVTIDGQERWMTSCVKECPANYPWIGNPQGA